jgi:hypothetical protein
MRWVAFSTRISSLASALSTPISHANAAARMTAWRRMTNSTVICCGDEAVESGCFFVENQTGKVGHRTSRAASA